MTNLAQLEAEKAALLDSVVTRTAAWLAFRPVPASWSVLEVLDHLARSEAAILEAVIAGMPHPHRLGIRDRAGFRFLMAIFRSDRRVKAPRSVPQIQPQAGLLLPEICTRWAASRRELAAVLASAPAYSNTEGVFRHPVSGWMTLPNVLDFFSVHIHHHRFQLARLEAASHGRDTSSPNT